MDDEQIYTSIYDFYDEDRRRLCSGEADYGVWWHGSGENAEWPRWRVSYVQATGEVYAVQMGNSPDQKQVRVLGIVPPDNNEEHFYRTLDGILEGWAPIQNKTINWVRRRLEQWHLSTHRGISVDNSRHEE